MVKNKNDDWRTQTSPSKGETFVIPPHVTAGVVVVVAPSLSSPSFLSESSITVLLLPVRFLDAPSHLYKKSCPSVRPLVRSSVRPYVRPSVCPVLFSKAKSTQTWRILCRVSGLVLRYFVSAGKLRLVSRYVLAQSISAR